MKPEFNTPILFLIFNREHTTRRVFNAIASVKPSRLYVAADGPREHAEGDKERCALTRDVIQPDWNCELVTRYRNTNLGGKNAIIEALDWFFSQEEMGIILEDDCLPSNEFFCFAETMLNRFKQDTRVTHITSCNLQLGQKRGNASYYFSRIASVWGWASWRRAWLLNDPEMKHFPRIKNEKYLLNAFPNEKIATFITEALAQVYDGRVQTWDYPYGFSLLVNNGLTVVPNANLITNLGFDALATRTSDSNSIHANIPTESLGEIIHSEVSFPNIEADLFQLSLSAYNVSKSQLKRTTKQ